MRPASNRLSLLLLLATIGAAQAACGPPPTRTEDIVGRYVLSDESTGTIDFIDVLPKGRYVHQHIPWRAPIVADSGTWSLDRRDGEERVFRNLRVPSSDANERPETLSRWPLLRTNRGEMKLIVNGDANIAYVKTPP
jgi:hypothetical protein